MIGPNTNFIVSAPKISVINKPNNTCSPASDTSGFVMAAEEADIVGELESGATRVGFAIY